MNTPTGQTPLDKNNLTLLGTPLDRVDGPLKVSGQATYAYEHTEGGDPAYGFIVEAGIAKGRITAIDASLAEKAPGVLLVLSHKNAPKQGKAEENEANPQFTGTEIKHHGQPVALVVATTFEAARAAARQVKISYDEAKGAFDLDALKDKAKKPQPMHGSEPDSSAGDFEKAFAASSAQIDATYTTPAQSHAMTEPHATLALWQDETLTVYTANQMICQSRDALAKTLLVPKENVRMISHYIGGGFGSKLHIRADVVLAALAARMLQKPVKLALTRQQIFHITTCRTPTIQRIRLGANQQGVLNAIAHESWSQNLPGYGFYETAANQTRSLYASQNRLTRHRLAETDLPQSDSMRAPGEAVGMLALECAMDELAEKLKLDPIELRIRNEPKEDPEKHIPFSTRQLVPCMKEGARLFGWDKRHTQPALQREGDWLVGMGMAAASRGNPLGKAQCAIKLDGDGRLTIRAAMTDLGTGSYTILTQIAGEMLGLPPEKITVLMGDTDFPETPGSGGSWGASSAGSALYDACMKLREQLARAAAMPPDQAAFSNGSISAAGQEKSLASLAGANGMEAKGEIDPGESRKKFAQNSYGALFAEVAVDAFTGETRLRRMLGVFAAGRILNAKTARSQLIGGMVFGVGAALTEEIAIDKNYGFFVNHDYAEYHVPAHADIPAIEAVCLPERDDKACPLKSKGVGELGICGAGAAIANAVYNATGVRVRDYPLTLDKIFPHLPPMRAA